LTPRGLTPPGRPIQIGSEGRGWRSQEDRRGRWEISFYNVSIASICFCSRRLRRHITSHSEVRCRPKPLPTQPPPTGKVWCRAGFRWLVLISPGCSFQAKKTCKRKPSAKPCERNYPPLLTPPPPRPATPQPFAMPEPKYPACGLPHL
jgi:hypothetical protein